MRKFIQTASLITISRNTKNHEQTLRRIRRKLHNRKGAQQTPGYRLRRLQRLQRFYNRKRLGELIMKKEWKGNSDSVRTRLGVNKAHTTQGREQDDFYATDPEALQKLLDGCSLWLKEKLDSCKTKPAGTIQSHITGYVWECACGNGNLAECLNRNGFLVYASDLKDRGYGCRGIDFLQSCAPVFTDIILTNPPYSLANEFILHAMQILPEQGIYIALMNITYIAGQKRFREIYSKHYLREMYVFSKRVNCYRNNDKETYGEIAMVDFAWYVFQKGYTGQPTIYWL